MRRLLLYAATAAAAQTERVLVRFDEYAPSAWHRATVSKALGPEGRHWVSADRRRRHVPTDFLALHLTRGARRALQHLRVDPDRSTMKPKFRNLTQGATARYRVIVAPGKEALATWNHGERGQNATVAIFDTGLRSNHPHFPKQPEERINWTSERTLSDTFGHGTFIASVVAGVSEECPGFAPHSKLRIHKVFTNQQVSYTSWFLDAFNYLLHQNDVDVINLSVGGPDFADRPFGDKVKEIVASGITLVSAMGNDGPAWGTLNAPGDAVEVVGVGASEADSGRVAAISSRGFPLGDRVPRMKPDYLAPGMGVLGAVPGGATCSPNHGTSVASPSIAGVAALVASAARRAGTAVRNPAMVRQCLNEASTSIKDSMWAQGFGRIDSLKAVQCAETYVPRVTLVPPSFDLVKDCPYLSPLCDQPLIKGGLPIRFNVTVLNGLGVLGKVTDLQWAGSTSVKVEAQYPVTLWPFAGAFAVQIKASPDASIGVHEGTLWVRVEQNGNTCSDASGEGQWVAWPVSVEIAEKPDKKRRLLWDASHSLTYPPSFSPRDNLNQNADLLDWNGDLPFTNFRGLFKRLRSRGYFVDVWYDDLTCAPLQDYGALLIVDAEDIYSRDEIKAVHASGTSLVIVADWADPELQDQTRFFDDNTQVAWQPAVGGANVVELNKLLKPFSVQLGGGAWEGALPQAFGAGSRFESGSVIARAPIGGYVVKARLEKRVSLKRGGTVKVEAPQAVLAAVDNEQGRVVVFGDTGCLDDWKRTGRACWELLEASVAFAVSGVRSKAVLPDTARLVEPLVIGEVPPDAPPSPLLKKYSRHYDAKQPYVEDPPPKPQTCGNDLRVVETHQEGWSPV